jgi:DnaK suppressor protein
MEPEQLDHFRRKLEEQREALNALIAEAMARAREPVEGGFGEVGDEPVRDLVVDTALEVGERRTREREEIDDALQRIERGEYGLCEACGRPIELERLEVMPMARLCEADARRADVEKRSTL